MPIRAVLFDRDGVLVRVDWQGIRNTLMSKLPMPSATLDQRWQNWNHARVDLPGGDPRRVDEFLQTIACEMNDPEAREVLLRFRLANFVHAYSDARPALEYARAAGLRIGVLSNNSILLGSREALALVGLDELVDVALTAQELGVSKPEPEAYRRAAEALGVQLEECLFFDDHANAVIAARSLGIHAFLVDRTRKEDGVALGVVKDLSAFPRRVITGAERLRETR